MSVPSDIRDEVKRAVWERAAALDWLHLSPPDKARCYAQWTEEEKIGGLLAGYIDRGRVHVYLKDTLLKGYARQQQSDDLMARRVLDIAPDLPVLRSYTRPHGRRFADGRVICWGRAAAWKLVLMALYERTYRAEGMRPHGAVLTNAAGQYSEARFRGKVEDAAAKLDIELVRWC